MPRAQCSAHSTAPLPPTTHTRTLLYARRIACAKDNRAAKRRAKAAGRNKPAPEDFSHLYIYMGHAPVASSARGAAGSPTAALPAAVSRAAQTVRQRPCRDAPAHGNPGAAHQPAQPVPRRGKVVEAKLNEHRTSCTCAFCAAQNVAPTAVPHKHVPEKDGNPARWERGQERGSYCWRVCPCRVWELTGQVPAACPAPGAPVTIPAGTSADVIKRARVHRDNNAVDNMMQQVLHMHTHGSTATPRLEHLRHGQAGRTGSDNAIQ